MIYYVSMNNLPVKDEDTADDMFKGFRKYMQCRLGWAKLIFTYRELPTSKYSVMKERCLKRYNQWNSAFAPSMNHKTVTDFYFWTFLQILDFILYVVSRKCPSQNLQFWDSSRVKPRDSLLYINTAIRYKNN